MKRQKRNQMVDERDQWGKFSKGKKKYGIRFYYTGPKEKTLSDKMFECLYSDQFSYYKTEKARDQAFTTWMNKRQRNVDLFCNEDWSAEFIENESK